MNSKINRISVYVRSIGISPSGYYRIMQYLNKLNVNVKINNIVPPNIYRLYLHLKCKNFFISLILYLLMYCRIIFFLIIDIFYPPKTIVISRGLIPRYMMWPLLSLLKLIRKKCKRIIWDFDDDILVSKEISLKEFETLEIISDIIIVTHKYLASKIRQDFQYKSIILPTTDGDFEKFDIKTVIEGRANTITKKINIVWIGSAVNLKNLNFVINALDRAAEYQKHKHNRTTSLFICSSEHIEEKTNHLQIKNIRWSPDIAIKTLLNSHIGIMPLVKDKYALGKGGFKLVQYMASGLPIIGSNVGYNKQIINNNNGRIITNLESEEEWTNAINELSECKESFINYSFHSRNTYEKDFYYYKNLEIWKNII